MVTTPCQMPSRITIGTPSCAYGPKVCSFVYIAVCHKPFLTIMHIFLQSFTQCPATITASARISFGAPPSGITHGQGKGKGTFATKPTYISAVFLASTALSDTSPRPAIVYICF